MSFNRPGNLSLVLLIVLCGAVWAQISSSTGAIQGTVTDPQNAVIGGARVVLTNTDTGATAETASQTDGTFVFPLLVPGNYKIQVQAQGFETSELAVRVDVTKVINAITVNQNSNNNASLRVPVPGFSPAGLNLVTNQGYSHYNGFILEANHAFAHSFQFKMDYTYSKSTDNDSGPTGSDLDSFTNNQLVPAGNRGISDFDLTHRFVFTGVWDLPGPKTGFLGQTIGKWHLSGVWTIQSGLPLNITSTNGGGLGGLNGSVTIRANANACSSMKTSGSPQQNLNNYMNAACFSAVPNLSSGTALTSLNAQQGPGTGPFTIGNSGVASDSGVGSLFGNLGRNILRGPGAERLDIALVKTFPVRYLGEAGNFSFRAEAFKLFNNPIFSNPQANISNTATFGHITSTVDGTGRILQLALKLNF